MTISTFITTVLQAGRTFKCPKCADPEEPEAAEGLGRFLPENLDPTTATPDQLITCDLCLGTGKTIIEYVAVPGTRTFKPAPEEG